MADTSLKITVNPDLYLKDPSSSSLGISIVSKSIEMISEIGFESFTFKKLGQEIGSNESSIYRYFENKHMLLVYLVNWYWAWMEYRIVFGINMKTDWEDKLSLAIEMLTQDITKDEDFSFINEILLKQIIIAESSKAYLTKDVDKENEKGFYKTYKRVVQRVSDMVLTINPNFKYPHMLISTVIEGAHHQRFFSKHLPSLTDYEAGKNNIVVFYKDLVFKTIKA